MPLILCLLIMIASLAQSVQAHVVRVPADAPTIQQGLDMLAPNDTILITLHTYAEAVIAPEIPFWMIGDVPVDTGDFARPTIDVSLTGNPLNRNALTLPLGSSASIERLRFSNQAGWAQCHGAVLQAAQASFSNCVFDSLSIGITQNQHAIPAIVNIEHCTFQDYASDALLPVSAVHASDCLFKKMQGLTQLACAGNSVVENCVFIDALLTTVTVWGQNNFVRNCLFTNQTDSIAFAYVYLHDFGGQFENNLITHINIRSEIVRIGADCRNQAVIRNNIISDSRFVNPPGAIAPLLKTLCDSSGTVPYRIEYNEMYACTTGGFAKGILAEGRGVFLGNRLHELAYLVDPSVNAVYCRDVDTLIFRDNLLYHNQRAMYAENGTIVDARWNYWGDSTGPYHPTENPQGAGDMVSGNVTVTPWYPDTSFVYLSDVHAPLPDHFELSAYPNPFNSSVTLTLLPPEAMIVRLELFDVLGRRVQELWNGPIAFEKQITFDGSHLSSGIYFARVWQPIGNHPLAMTKLVLLK